MAQGPGNPTGPIYPFGFIAPAVAGTPAPLNQRVSFNTSIGTPAAGIPGLTVAGNPAIIVFNQLIISASKANTGSVYVCYKGTNKNSANGVGIIMQLQAGGFFNLASPQLSNPFQADQIVIDADVNGEGAWCTAVIV